MHAQFSCAGFETLICVKNKIIFSFNILNTTVIMLPTLIFS